MLADAQMRCDAWYTTTVYCAVRTAVYVLFSSDTLLFTFSVFCINTVVNHRRLHKMRSIVVVAQWLEHLSYSQVVEGSIPSNDYARLFFFPVATAAELITISGVHNNQDLI